MQRFVLSVLFLFAFSNVLLARERLTNWAIGPHMTISFPQSRLADYSRVGEGLGAKILYRWKAAPFFTPRFDITYLSFGEKRSRIPGSPYIYDVIQTRNESFQLTIGPQFSKKLGRLTLYAHPVFGYYNFRTIITINDYYYESIYGTPYSETKGSRTRPGWGANAGLMFDIGLGPHLDLQLNYQKISQVVKTVLNNQSVYKDAEDFSISFGVVFFLKEKY